MAQFFQIHPVNPQPRLIRLAAEILRAGGVIAYPTDSSYALGCHIGDAAAAKRIRELRGVGTAHHLTLVLRDLSEIGHFARLDTWQFRIVRQGTPGCYTFLLPATREVPRRLQHPKRSTVGVRVPEHPVVQALLAELREPDPAGRNGTAERRRGDSRGAGRRARPRHRRGRVPGGADDRRRPCGRAAGDHASGGRRSGAARAIGRGTDGLCVPGSTVCNGKVVCDPVSGRMAGQWI
jgi:hypothetical protein